MNAPQLKVLIVDDEPLARQGISDYVARVDFLTEVGRARDGMEALRHLEELPVDLVFLDIQMPGLSGVELVQSLRKPPAVIFTTAHPGFAVEGFELNAIDYLLKPIGFPRFLKAVLKAKDRLATSEYGPASPSTASLPSSAPASAPPDAPADDLFVKVDGRVERIAINDILYAESMQNYCRIYTTGGSHLPLLPLKELEEALPTAGFLRIHRSYIVRLAAVDAIDGHQVRVGEKLLPVSRANREELQRRLVGGRLL